MTLNAFNYHFCYQADKIYFPSILTHSIFNQIIIQQKVRESVHKRSDTFQIRATIKPITRQLRQKRVSRTMSHWLEGESDGKNAVMCKFAEVIVNVACRMNYGTGSQRFLLLNKGKAGKLRLATQLWR